MFDLQHVMLKIIINEQLQTVDETSENIKDVIDVNSNEQTTMKSNLEKRSNLIYINYFFYNNCSNYENVIQSIIIYGIKV